MISPFDALLQLQQLDQQKIAFHERLGQIPVEQAEIRHRLDAAQQAKAQAQQHLDDCQKQRRTKEQDVQTHEERLNKLKTRLTEIKTNKEYHAHLGEIDTAKQAQTHAEDEVLALMEQTETLAQQVAQATKQLAEAEVKTKAEEAALEEERGRVTGLLEKLEADSAQLEPTIDPALLKEYRRLHKRWKGSAIAPIQNGSCTGCRLAVPPQLIAEVRRHEKAQYCPHCGRFLYWPHTTVQASE
jgi:predicted  nucleic acid-binding Zn-ribbon protein